MKRQTTTALCAALALFANAQSAEWLTGGNTGQNALTDFLGNADNKPMNIRTEDIRRFRLNFDETYTIGSFAAQVKNGSLLLSPDVDNFYTAGALGPFSLLHLAAADNTAQQASYRAWMNTGITFTGNADQGYVGQKAEELDYTDMVLHWSDNPGKTLKDRLRFIFTSGYSSMASTGATSAEGLEGMRLFPLNNDEVNVGLGDFFAGVTTVPMTVTEPTERLDILNGRVRLRDLPTDPQASTLNKYLVVDDVDPSSPEYGVLKWRNLPPSATPGCEWYSEPLPAFREVRSGLGNVGTGSCPDRGWLYTVGQNGALNAKFSLYQNSNERNVQSGLGVAMVTKTGSASESFGIRAVVQPATGEVSNAAYGVYGYVQEPAGSYGNGIYGKVRKTTTASVIDMNGVSGYSELTATGIATNVYGTLGDAYQKGTATRSIGTMGRSAVSSTVSNTSESCGVKGTSTSYAASITNSYGGNFTTGIQYNGSVANGYGVFATSNGAGGSQTNSYGVFASAMNGSAFNYGVKAYAQGLAGSVNYGIHAGTNWTVNNVDWAGYFSGSVYSPYGTWQPSDMNLKSDIAEFPATSASEILNSVQLHTFRYNVDQFPQMNLPEGVQVGVLAQELEEVLPGSVRSAVEPAVYDEMGELLHGSVPFKAVNYGSFIPYLVAAYQNESAERIRLEERLATLEERLNDCCSDPDGSRSQEQGIGSFNEVEGAVSGSDKLRIQPNPFSESTTIYYTLERSGRTQLIANSADGKELRVLQEASLEVGSYQYEWHTADLADGMYYVTLLLDGQPVVKKAVKVSR